MPPQWAAPLSGMLSFRHWILHRAGLDVPQDAPLQGPALRLWVTTLPSFLLLRHSVASPPSPEPSTIFTGCDVAALPVCWSGPPGAVVLHDGPVGADVHAVHAPRLEAVVPARGRADGPEADPPVHATGICPAVLGAQWPVGRGREGHSSYVISQR